MMVDAKLAFQQLSLKRMQISNNYNSTVRNQHFKNVKYTTWGFRVQSLAQFSITINNSFTELRPSEKFRLPRSIIYFEPWI